MKEPVYQHDWEIFGSESWGIIGRYTILLSALLGAFPHDDFHGGVRRKPFLHESSPVGFFRFLNPIRGVATIQGEGLVPMRSVHLTGN